MFANCKDTISCGLADDIWRGMMMNGKLWAKLVVGISSLVIVGLIVTVLIVPNTDIIPYNYNLTSSCAVNHTIQSEVITDFGTYIPELLEYTPAITPAPIKADLSNVDLQEQYLSENAREMLGQYGFALENAYKKDLFDLYNDKYYSARFVTTDLCLHAYHVFFDISLRVLEGEMFFEDFDSLLYGLCEEQIAIRNDATESLIKTASERNIAYLSVMLKLLDENYVIPSYVSSIVTEELQKITNEVSAYSAIFDYLEDYSQYKVRGHYTRNENLTKYFKAMMYAGRMGFVCKAVPNNPTLEIEQTRRALILVSSFNATYQGSTMWEYWDKVYQPTVFYVGKSDDLTPEDYYSILRAHDYPEGNALASEELIQTIIGELEEYRNPKINSMLVDFSETTGAPKTFRLMGQRFIPDGYIHQQLANPYVKGRSMVNGLDVFSVLGSDRAAYHLRNEPALYGEYTPQINSLRGEFYNLSDYDWVQNLYWSWLYTLFPLLKTQETEGYPGFMNNEAWQDKSLQTAMGSWAELRHDTLLYAKSPFGSLCAGGAPEMKGYVEPYPELYSRLASMTRLTKEGLENRGTTLTLLINRLTEMITIFDELVELSIKELENNPLTETDLEYIHYVGERLGDLCNFEETVYEGYLDDSDLYSAIIADVFTDPVHRKALEVGIGYPYKIYVIVQDEAGNLRLTQGATFSYYEFLQPMTQRLNDEEWFEMLRTNPPDIPEWIENSLPFIEPEEYEMLLAETKRK